MEDVAGAGVDEIGEVDGLGAASQRAQVHQGGAGGGQFAFETVGIALVEVGGGGQLERGVTQELEPFVGVGGLEVGLIDQRTMDQRPYEQRAVVEHIAEPGF